MSLRIRMVCNPSIPVILIIFLMFVALSGCVSVLTSTGPDTFSGDGGSGTIKVALLEQDSQWTLSRGCTWVATFHVSNTDDTVARNVELYVELVNAGNGSVRDAKKIFIGTLAPGESRSVRMDLDGECTEDYTVRAIPLFS
jgi:uncharacterized protein YceK